MMPDEFSLVPYDLLRETDVPFIHLILVMLGYGLSDEPAVQQFVGAEPGLLEDIRSLSAAVGAADLRVHEAGLLKNGFDDHLKYYEPAEIWCFDLAIDVIAMLGGLTGLTDDGRSRTTQALRDLDATAQGHTWRKALKHAADGPASLGALRERVPRHTPDPAHSTGRPSSVTWM
ncbi:MAG: hypothetical protein ABSA93_32665 [Streptosporangiaceae bacterium]|jgi:hypothetical protein